MDPTLEQSIASAVTSAVTTALATLHAKHDDDIRSLRKMLKKALPVKNSISPLLGQDDLLPNAQASAADDAVGSFKSTSTPDLTSKMSQERWN